MKQPVRSRLLTSAFDCGCGALGLAMASLFAPWATVTGVSFYGIEVVGVDVSAVILLTLVAVVAACVYMRCTSHYTVGSLVGAAGAVVLATQSLALQRAPVGREELEAALCNKLVIAVDMTPTFGWYVFVASSLAGLSAFTIVYLSVLLRSERRAAQIAGGLLLLPLAATASYAVASRLPWLLIVARYESATSQRSSWVRIEWSPVAGAKRNWGGVFDETAVVRFVRVHTAAPKGIKELHATLQLVDKEGWVLDQRPLVGRWRHRSPRTRNDAWMMYVEMPGPVQIGHQTMPRAARELVLEQFYSAPASRSWIGGAYEYYRIEPTVEQLRFHSSD